MGSQKEQTEQKASPQDQAIRDVISRFLLDMLSQGPDSFVRYQREGPRPYPQISLTDRERRKLGYLGGPESGMTSGLSPHVAAGQQRMQAGLGVQYQQPQLQSPGLLAPPGWQYPPLG